MPGGGENGGQDGGDCGSEFRDPRTTLGVEEMVSEEEARRRREQLNRRPSYRMILKDLETVGDKPLKKELDDHSPTINNQIEQAINESSGGASVAQSSSNSLQQLPDSSTDSPNFAQNGGGVHIIGAMQNPGGPMKPTAAPHLPPPGLRVGVSAPTPIAHISPPTQAHINLGQLNLLASAAPQTRLIAEIPSQPQPQIQPPNATAPQPLLAAVNNLEMLGLKAPESLQAAFSQNDWQNNLLSSYNRQQLQQQQPPAHLLQNASSSALNNSNIQQGGSPGIGQQQVGGPPHGLGTRQGSASLTSLSDNDETSRKRQVRLLKNREAAKECRRKKKEYVKCLENRVAVLENQNKALIEELKTLKELYCRKEKGDGQ